MKLRILLMTGMVFASFAAGVRARDDLERDRAMLTAQMLLMTLPQCLLVDSDHAERAQDGWKRWWKARADLLPKQYKQRLTPPPKVDSGMFALSEDETREICEKALAGIEDEQEARQPAAPSP